MKLTLDRDVLADALRIVAPAAAKNAHLPVLAGVRIDVNTQAGTATFTCTDLDFTATHVLDGITSTEDETGTAIVGAQLLGRLVDRLPAGPVQLGIYDSQLIVIAGDTEANLHTLPGEDWPRSAEVDGETVTFDEQQLDDLRAIVGWASADKVRPVLTGVYFHGGRATATDSYRIAMIDLGKQVPEALVPAKALTAILRTAGDELTMKASQRHARFTAGMTTWQTQLIEGDFPKAADQFAELQPPQTLTVDRRRLVEAVKRVTTLGAGGDEVGAVVLTVDGGKVTVERARADVGTIDDTLSCEGPDKTRIAFQPAFLVDLLETAGGDEVAMRFTDEVKPVVCRAERRTLLVMPVKVPKR